MFQTAYKTTQRNIELKGKQKVSAKELKQVSDVQCSALLYINPYFTLIFNSTTGRIIVTDKPYVNKS